MTLSTTLEKCLRLGAIAACLACAATTSSLEAQQSVSAAQGFYSPQERAISGRYSPRYMRPAGQQPVGNAVVQDTAPSTVPDQAAQVQSTPQLQVLPQQQYIPQAQLAPHGHYYHSGPVVGAPIDEVIVGDGCYGGDCGGGECCDPCGCGSSSCFGECGCGPTVDPRDCCIAEDCWLDGLGGLLCNSEFFVGVHAFRNQVFVARANQIEQELDFESPENCSFGYHLGFNTGVPLYRLTCGLATAQVGVRYTSSNLNDGVFATGERNQTFFTGGLYRRVDYGLQFGAVADVLNESWLPDLNMVQIRSEISWVWGGSGSTAGLRVARNVQDDSGFVGGVFLPEINASTLDWYRLFYQHVGAAGGYSEFYLGWTDEDHAMIGADYDLPLGPRTALLAGFTYMIPNEDLPFTDNEAWNLTMGLTWRPRGTEWYQFYHRPLFRVADNGSMIMSRFP